MRLAVAAAVVALTLPACAGGSPPPSPALSAEATSSPLPEVTENMTERQPAQFNQREGQPKRPTSQGQGPNKPPPPPGRDKKPEPIYEDGIPQVKVSPSRGPVGSRVRIDGYGFTDEQWRSAESSLWLVGAGSGTCQLYASAQHTIRITPEGHLTGEFTVPAVGDCRQEERQEPVTPGRYTITYQCTPCTIGRFEVIPS